VAASASGCSSGPLIGRSRCFSLVVPPGAMTPVHDHLAWGFVGLYTGNQDEEVYRPGSGRLELERRRPLSPGGFYVLMPPRNDVHRVRTTSAVTSVSALNGAFDGLYPKGIRAYWKRAFVKDLPDAAIAAHVEHGSRVPEVSATMHMYPINGACHGVGHNDTAFAYREATYGMVFLASWADPSKDAERIQWVRDYHQAMTPYSEPGGYINFMQDDDYGKIRDNYRENYDQLVEVKR
jgi:hypothetical protein